MTPIRHAAALLYASLALATSLRRQARRPGAASADIPVSHRDRVYAAEQFSNTVSVTDPVDNKLLGVIRLGDPSPGNFSPLYRGQVLVHGMGFSPDHRTLAVVSIGSNSVTFIDTATNAVKHTTYVGRSPHEAFFTPDGKEVWVTVRGENYVSVIDASHLRGEDPHRHARRPRHADLLARRQVRLRVLVLQPRDGRDRHRHDQQIVGRVKQDSPFCPNIAATPDGKQVWFTLKDIGRTMVFDARPPFAVIKSFDTGPITNHVNFATTKKGSFAYVTIGGLNQMKVFRTDDFSQVATIPVGKLPHGVWPSGDGTRIYVGLENADALAAIDTATNKVVGEVPDRPGAAGDCLCAQCCARGRWPARAPAARRRGAGRAPDALGGAGRQGRCADQRHAVRSGVDAGVAGFGDGPGAEDALCARAGRATRRWRNAAAAGQLHDQSGGLGHRERHRPDPSDRAVERGCLAALPRDRAAGGGTARQSRCRCKASESCSRSGSGCVHRTPGVPLRECPPLRSSFISLRGTPGALCTVDALLVPADRPLR
jgi:YVTN family beta-propeller protein